MSMLKAPLRLQAHQAAIAEASKTASIFHGGPKTRFILPTPPARRQDEPELKLQEGTAVPAVPVWGRLPSEKHGRNGRGTPLQSKYVRKNSGTPSACVSFTISSSRPRSRFVFSSISSASISRSSISRTKR